MRPKTCRHVAQPIPHGVAPQQSPAMLRLRGKDSDMEQTSDIKPKIFSLQNDPLDYNSFFSACILTYTPVYPNPGGNTLNIRTGLQNAHVEVYDMNGKLIHNQKITETTTSINAENWASGSYVWKVVSNGKEAETGKWIKLE